jgi:hypothetical protein
MTDSSPIADILEVKSFVEDLVKAAQGAVKNGTSGVAVVEDLVLLAPLLPKIPGLIAAIEGSGAEISAVPANLDAILGSVAPDFGISDPTIMAIIEQGIAIVKAAIAIYAALKGHKAVTASAPAAPVVSGENVTP